MGFSDKTWNQWFNKILDSYRDPIKEQSALENAFEKNHYKKIMKIG